MIRIVLKKAIKILGKKLCWKWKSNTISVWYFNTYYHVWAKCCKNKKNVTHIELIFISLYNRNQVHNSFFKLLVSDISRLCFPFQNYLSSISLLFIFLDITKSSSPSNLSIYTWESVSHAYEHHKAVLQVCLSP